jgi:hypothetical protein
MSRIYLLSPANLGGRRAEILLRPEAEFALAEQVRSEQGAALGDVFSFVSGLYFRGKMAYAGTFADPPRGQPGALVITGGRGLLPLDTWVTTEDLHELAKVPIDPREDRYVRPLDIAVRQLRADLPHDGQVVLLGSLSSAKYVELLLTLLGDRLWFPEAFVGMGDMQRGSLMLKAAQARVPLTYVRAQGAVRSRAIQKPSGRSGRSRTR